MSGGAIGQAAQEQSILSSFGYLLGYDAELRISYSLVMIDDPVGQQIPADKVHSPVAIVKKHLSSRVVSLEIISPATLSTETGRYRMR